MKAQKQVATRIVLDLQRGDALDEPVEVLFRKVSADGPQSLRNGHFDATETLGAVRFGAAVHRPR